MGMQCEQQAAQRMALRLAYSGFLEGLIPPGCAVTITGRAPRVLTSAGAVLRDLFVREAEGAQTLHLTGCAAAQSLDDPLAFADRALRDFARATLGPAFSTERWDRVLGELADSLRNEVLATQAQQALFAKVSPVDNLLCWLSEEGSGRDALLLQLGAFSGHRTHPATKMRLLLDPADPRHAVPLSIAQSRAFAPEFAPDVALPLLAVRAARCTTRLSANLTGTYTAYMRQSFPQAFAAWAQACGEDAPDLLPIPVHPLHLPQLRHRFAWAMVAGEVREVPGAQVVQRPTLSLRTLTPVSRLDEPQIKTTIAMQMTSVVRTLAPARAYNAPVFSDLLTRIVAQDDDLCAVVRVVEEPVSVYWGQDPDPGRGDYQDGYHLAAVFKANPAGLVAADELRLPLNTLFAASPFGAGRILTDVMRASGVDGAATATAFVRSYARVVAGADIGMLARYGVGLESHQQNIDMILSHEGAPRALLYRDINGGVELYAPLLALNGYHPDRQCHPVRKGLHDALTVPLQQTAHTTLGAHLLPLVHIVAHAFDVPEPDLFGIIRDELALALEHVQTRHVPRLLRRLSPAEAMEARAVYAQVLARIGDNLLRQPLQTKCLLTMRALQSQRMVFTGVSNPLQSSVRR